jgi:hypothetical protein
MQNKKQNGEIKAYSKARSGHMQVQRKKDSPYPKKKEERKSYKKKQRGVHTKIHKISAHLHILIRLYDLFLLGSSF